ncbi:MAG: FMN-binding protein [Clostridiales bacterium]|nr:FMN-binding protein [Clostridiales bacterium]
MKKFAAFFLCLCLAVSLAAPASAEPITAQAQGFGSIVKVTVTYDGDKIVALEVDDSGETYPVPRADSVEKVIAAIIEANGTTGVDTKTGATATCNAIVNAVDATKALIMFGMGGSGMLPSNASVEAKEIGFTAGEYEATAEGFNGPTVVKVTFTDKAIEKIEIVSTGETDTVGVVAFETLIPLMIEANGTGVDGVTGATFSSDALRTAVNDAAEQAGCTDLEAFKAATVEPAEEAPAK